MAADNQDQGYVPLYSPKGITPAAAPTVAAAAAVRDPNDQGYVPLYQKPGGGQQTVQQQTAAPPAQPAQGWGVDWSKPGGEVTMPQPVRDWGAIAGNEAAMGLPGLKAQADAMAARQRLGPAASAVADVAGNLMSPTTLLNAVGGPVLAGGVHEGIKSYMSQPNWIPDAQGMKRIGEDTAGGAAWGALGLGAAKAAPAVAPVLSRVAVQGGIPTLLGAAGHQLFGQGDIYRELTHMAPEFASIFALDEAGKSAAAMAKNAFSSPMARQAIQNLILGGGSAARTAAGPYDQWIPGQ